MALDPSYRIANGLAALLLVLPVSGSAGGSTGIQYALLNSVVDAGGGRSETPSHVLYSSLGQRAPGAAATGLYRLEAGFLAGIDGDGDGLSDAVEAVLHTHPLQADSDGDGLSDFEEVTRDGNPYDYQVGVDTDPNNPDTDGDGIPDGADPVLNLADGDVVPNGQLDAGDLLRALRIALGLERATAADLAHGDLYPAGAPDGVIDLSDFSRLVPMVLGASP